MRPRLFAHVVGTEARRLMSYRVDFWITALAGFGVSLMIAWFLWRSLLGDAGEIQGYTLDRMLRYYVLTILLAKLVRGPERGGALSQEIYDGSYTRYLVYPTGYFAFQYARHLGGLLPCLAQLLVFGATAPFFLDDPLQGIGWASAGMALASLAVANLLHFLMLYPIQAVAFWADNVWSLMVMAHFATNLLGGFFLPLDLFPDWAQRLAFHLPFPYFFYVPVKVLVGELPFHFWLQGMGVALAWCAILVMVGQAVWRRGDRQYTGVGI